MSLPRGKWRLVPLTVRLPANLHRRLATVARGRDMTVAELVYRVLDFYLSDVHKLDTSSRLDTVVQPLATTEPKETP